MGIFLAELFPRVWGNFALEKCRGMSSEENCADIHGMQIYN